MREILYKDGKQMIYSFIRKIEVLDSGKCCDYNYYILSLGTHPVAYVEIPKTHKLYGTHYDNIDVDVHGGLTYSKDNLWLSDTEELRDNWFIGWDYAHFGDYLGYEEMYPIKIQLRGKKWTIEEIRQDVYDVCKQLERLKYK